MQAQSFSLEMPYWEMVYHCDSLPALGTSQITNMLHMMLSSPNVANMSDHSKALVQSNVTYVAQVHFLAKDKNKLWVKIIVFSFMPTQDIK